MKLCIIFRTCEVVESVHGTPRPFGLTKKSVIDACFHSLLRALSNLQGDVSLVVVGDRLSRERQAFFAPSAQKMVIGEYGNGPSIEQTFRVADEQDEGTVLFFCEDDYLFVPHALAYMMDLYANRQRYFAALAQFHLFVHPPDYPDRYLWPDPHTGAMTNFYQILLSDYCHWRQIPSTTYTFLCTKEAYVKHRATLWESAPNWNDRLLSERIYRNELCVSPLPGLASHMHEGAMTPLVDWRGVLGRGEPQAKGLLRWLGGK
jgi:hypothetical protein